MANIKCADGYTRTTSEYKKWIKNLAQLARLEPGDLTREERIALIEAGYDY